MNQQEKIMIPTFSTMEIISIENIVWLHASTNYTRVYLFDGSEILSTMSFGKLTYQLHENCILTCHKSYAINLHHLNRYHKDGMAEMDNGARVPVARRRREAFVEGLETCFGVKVYLE